MLTRIVQPELLDALPCDHPEARRSRRDLRLLNLFMGNHRWLARTLRSLAARSERGLELGAGTGELAMRLRRQGRPIDALDTWPAPPGWPPAARWYRTDLRRFSGYGTYPIVYGNLIFHQFGAGDLRELGARLRPHGRLLLACEPARRRWSQWLFRSLSPLFGASRITRHDGRVSIAAGFLADELPCLLGLSGETWTWRCLTTPLGAYRMIAWRHDSEPPTP